MCVVTCVEDEEDSSNCASRTVYDQVHYPAEEFAIDTPGADSSEFDILTILKSPKHRSQRQQETLSPGSEIASCGSSCEKTARAKTYLQLNVIQG
jgi:hypothetical protein